LLKLFETAGHPAKVLCVALDYAKAQHTALFCNGLGELLKPSFAIDNTPQGAAKLLSEVRACVKPRKIRSEHVFFGGEDYPSYAENFLRHLRQEKFLVVARPMPGKPSNSATNFQASMTVWICWASPAAVSIGGASRSATCPKPIPICGSPPRPGYAGADAHGGLQPHPQLRGPALSGFPFRGQKVVWSPSPKPAWKLMADRFSPAQLSRRPRQALAEWLGRRGVTQPETRPISSNASPRMCWHRPQSKRSCSSRPWPNWWAATKTWNRACPDRSRGRPLAGQNPRGLVDFDSGLWDYAGGRLDRRTGAAQPVALGAPALLLLRGRAQKQANRRAPKRTGRRGGAAAL